MVSRQTGGRLSGKLRVHGRVRCTLYSGRTMGKPERLLAIVDGERNRRLGMRSRYCPSQRRRSFRAALPADRRLLAVAIGKVDGDHKRALQQVAILPASDEKRHA